MTTGCKRGLLLGAPGSGKGTIGRAIAAWLGVPHISSGHLLRSTIRAGDPYRIGELIARGQLISDEVVAEVVREKLGDGFVLDGYPRTEGQARSLDAVLERSGRSIQVVLELVVPDDVAIARLARRLEAEGRADDANPDTVAARLAVYHREAGALRAHYRSLVRAVDATGTPAEVIERAKQAIAADLPAASSHP